MSQRPIVIVGGNDDAESAAIYGMLQAMGERPIILDGRDSTLSIELGPTIGLGRIGACGNTFHIEQVKSVYWRVFHQPEDPSLRLLFESLMYWWHDDTLVVNPAHVVHRHWRKPIDIASDQDFILKSHFTEIHIPSTYWTSDSQQTNREMFMGETIVKPVGEGYAIAKVDGRDAEALNPMFSACVQSYCPGTVHSRFFIVGPSVFRIDIGSDALDWRTDPNVDIGGYLTHDDVAIVKEAVSLVRSHPGRKLGGVDVKYNADHNHWVFLECNPSPMWVLFDQRIGAGIGSALAQYLAEGLIEPQDDNASDDIPQDWREGGSDDAKDK